MLGSIVAAALVGQMFQEMTSDFADVLFENQIVKTEDGEVIEYSRNDDETSSRFTDVVGILLIIFTILGSILAYCFESFDPVLSVSKFFIYFFCSSVSLSSNT